MSIEDEAAAFKRAKAAERKRRERRGDYVLQVEVHLRSLANMLLVEGLLKESGLDDPAAISAATSEHLRKHQQVGRILPDLKGKEWDETSNWIWEQEEQEHPEREEELKAWQQAWAKRLEEQGPGPAYYGGPEAPEYVGDRRGQSGRNRTGRRVHYLDSMAINNSRGVTIGKAKIGAPVPGQGVKKAKPPTSKQIQAMEKKYMTKYGLDHLLPPDVSVHTVASNAGEVDHKLDQIAWEELGYAKRAAPKPKDDQ